MAYDEDLKKFNKKVEKALDDLTNSKNLSSIANDLAFVIKRRTRLGYGVEKSGDNKEKLAALKTSTVASRKKKKKKGNLAQETSPTKSNLTESGQMLNSLQGRAINKMIEIGPTGDRNKKLTAYHQLGNTKMAARKYLNLAKEDIKQLTATMQDRFSIILDKVFGKN